MQTWSLESKLGVGSPDWEYGLWRYFESGPGLESEVRTYIRVVQTWSVEESSLGVWSQDLETGLGFCRLNLSPHMVLESRLGHQTWSPDLESGTWCPDSVIQSW